MIAEEFILMDRREEGRVSEDMDSDEGSIEGVDPGDEAGVPVELCEWAELAVVCWEECG